MRPTCPMRIIKSWFRPSCEGGYRRRGDPQPGGYKYWLYGSLKFWTKDEKEDAHTPGAVTGCLMMRNKHAVVASNVCDQPQRNLLMCSHKNGDISEEYDGTRQERMEENL